MRLADQRDRTDEVDAATIDEAVARLLAGELVVLPTETVYGLAADAGNAAAVAGIYSLKGRPAGHPLIVHVSSMDQADRWARFDDRAQRLARALWPGPLTLIMARRADAPAHACGGHPTVGLRVPAHPVAQQVMRRFEAAGGLGLAAPSANRFGRISPTRAAHVMDDLGQAAPLVLDGGAARIGVESTIVDLSRGAIQILRPGAITAQQIARVLGESVRSGSDATGGIGSVADNLVIADAQAKSTPTAAPGTLAAHYAPLTRLELLAPAALSTRLTELRGSGMRIAVYARHCPSVAKAPSDATSVTIHCLPMPDSASDLAHRLYDDLRSLDAVQGDLILVEQPPSDPAYAAVADRLRRAAFGSGRSV